MGRLTTHVLDTAHGRPAAGVRYELFALGAERRRLAEGRTNADGRGDGPLLEGELFVAGTYELVFGIGEYFDRTGGMGQASAGRGPTPFLTDVPVRFTVADASDHYHVPLLVSPWSYTTYRGS